MLISRLYELEADPPVAAGPGAPNYRVEPARPGREPTAADPPHPSSLRLPSQKSAHHPARHRLAQKPGRSSRPVPVTPPVTPVPEPNLPGPNLPGPNQTADLTLPPPPRTASRRPPHQDRDRGAGDGAGAGIASRGPRPRRHPIPRRPNPPGAIDKGADANGLSGPPPTLLVGPTNTASCRVEPARPGRDPIAADPPRPLSLRLPRARIRRPPPDAARCR